MPAAIGKVVDNSLEFTPALIEIDKQAGVDGIDRVS